MFDYLTEDELKNRLGLIYLVLAIVSIIMVVASATPHYKFASGILMVFGFGLISFEIFKSVQHRKSKATTQSTGSPPTSASQPPSS